MDKIIIHGPSYLKGEVSISGAKNAALPILVSSLLSSGTYEISNVPHLKDIETILSLLSHLGATVKRNKEEVKISSDAI